MIKQLGIVVFAVGAFACSKGDKCEKAYDKVAPLMKDMMKKKDGAPDDKDDRTKMVEKCKADLKDHPEREKMLDCILGVSGDLTMDKMMECSKEERAERKKDKDDKSASGGGGGDFAEALAKMTEFKDAMCKCSDSACAQKVSDDMTKWSTEQAKAMKEPPKMTPEDTKKATEVATQMGECMQKAMGAGSAK